MKSTRFIQFTLLFLLLLIFNCRKRQEIPEKPTNLTATVISQTEIDLNWRDNSQNESGFKVERSNDGGSEWTVITSTSANALNYRNTGLTAGNSYIYKVLAYNAVGNSEYSNQASGTTFAAIVLSPPTVVTNSASSVTSTSATSGGNITSDGNSPVTARGVCWNTSAYPTITDSHTNDGSGTGSFTSSITGLTAGTQYFVRAYATNSTGTSYGEQDTINTPAPDPVVPTLTTTAVTEITSSSASSGGDIASDGGSDVISRGVCWSTSANPTTENSKTTDGSGTGAFISSLSGLNANTQYHVRAYATNSAGTGYGDEIIFTTAEESIVPPVVISAEATSISATSAILNGSVNANGSKTAVTFEYGETFLYGLSIKATPDTISGVTPTAFLATITDLAPNTQYHFRVKSVNGGGTVYGDDLTFTTLQAPVATTMEAQNIFPTTASLHGYVNGNGLLTTIKFEFGPTTSYGTILFGIPDNTSTAGNVESKLDITGLTKSTLYHFRIIAENSSGIAYGNDKTFTTLENDPVIPTVTTTAVTSITSSAATGGGNVTNDGGTEVTSRGICYSTNSSPTIEDQFTINGTGPGEFSSPFTGLTPGTLYYVRAYATNMMGTAYGNEVTFTSSPADAVLPVVSTALISDITYNSASGGGDITDDGGGTITARGVCWSTSEAPTTADAKTTDGTGSGAYVSVISGLDASTIYYVRAYATNSAGTAYGEQVGFTTTDTPAGLAVLTTLTTFDITSTSATSGGNISSDGGGSVTARGVCWSTSENPTTAGDKTTDGFGTGEFSSFITGLSPSTQYYIRAYAENAAGIAYGNQITITTLTPDPVLPTVSTASVADITHSTATGGGNVTHEGYATVTARGICWNISADPTLENQHSTDGSGSGEFISSITGLTPSTLYHVRAYATNSAGTAYGEDVTFTSAPAPYTLATLTTTVASSITSSTAATGGNISSDGGASVTARGVCYGTSENPAIDGNFTSDGSGIGSFSSALAGLSASTLYYVRSYATNAAGTAYGNQISFTTSAEIGYPVLTTTAISGIGSTTASSGGNISDDGDAGGPATITARGVCWSTGINPTIANSKTLDGSGTGSYSSSLTGLSPCTTYHVRAYATNSSGYTAYGPDIPFTTTTVLPTLTTTSISSISTTSAVSGGTLSGNCTAEVTAKGVCWSTSQNPTTANSKTSNGTGGGAYSSSITGLNPCTTYYVRAYATNSAGTVYGNQVSFTTSTVLATVSTTSVTSITSTTASSGGTVSGDCTAGVTARGVCWSTSQNPTTANSKTTNGTGAGTFTSSLTGLTPCTTYYVRAYATNATGTRYGNQISFTTGYSAPSVGTTAVSSITSSGAVSGGTISGNCAATVTARGVCWNTTGSPTTANSKTINGSGSGSFTSNITGLARTTTYYVRAYATYPGGTVYGGQRSFTTLAVLPGVSTSSISIVSNTNATGGGNVTNDGGSAVTAKGVCWSTSQNPTTANSKTTNGTGTGSYSSSISGLIAGTGYYVRAYATNAIGTAYGSNIYISTPAKVTYDGYTYKTVKIGSQTWMQENLRTTRYNDGTNLSFMSDTAQYPVSYYHSYQGNTTYGNTYGYLYNGSVVENTKNVCPVGWKVPTTSNWSTLASSLGGYTVAGGKMKDTAGMPFWNGFQWVTSYFYWNNAMTGHNNSSSFYGRGGGYYTTSYYGLGNYSRWWTSDNYQYVYIYYNTHYIYGTTGMNTGTDSHAYYIRCIKQ